MMIIYDFNLDKNVKNNYLEVKVGWEDFGGANNFYKKTQDAMELENDQENTLGLNQQAGQKGNTLLAWCETGKPGKPHTIDLYSYHGQLNHINNSLTQLNIADKFPPNTIKQF